MNIQRNTLQKTRHSHQKPSCSLFFSWFKKKCCVITNERETSIMRYYSVQVLVIGTLSPFSRVVYCKTPNSKENLRLQHLKPMTISAAWFIQALFWVWWRWIKRPESHIKNNYFDTFQTKITGKMYRTCYLGDAKQYIASRYVKRCTVTSIITSALWEQNEILHNEFPKMRGGWQAFKASKQTWSSKYVQYLVYTWHIKTTKCKYYYIFALFFAILSLYVCVFFFFALNFIDYLPLLTRESKHKFSLQLWSLRRLFCLVRNN